MRLKQFKVIANWEETAYMIYNAQGHPVNEDGVRTGQYIRMEGPILPEKWFPSFDEAQAVADQLDRNLLAAT